MRNYRQGYFKPENPKKYRGDPTNIVYRSSWEKMVMISLDANPSVLEWSSEEVIIPYISPIDGKKHRYFPDFFVKVRSREGSIVCQVLEVKPKKETMAPKKKKKITESYIYEVTTWGVNQAKWEAATKYCVERGWVFKVITEENLKIRDK